MPIHGNPGRAVMLLKQLKQLKLSGTLKNPDVESFARFYGSPAVCESLTTSKASKRLSRDDRRAVVESYVNEYRAANGGEFPTLGGTIKEVGGGFYVVRDIFQELKLKQNAPMPIVAKALSEVPTSVPNDASSQTLNDPQSHSAASFSTGVVDSIFQADTIGTRSDLRQATIDFSHPDSDEISLEGNTLVVTATQDKGETDTAPNNEVNSKWDINAHLSESQKEIALEASFKNSETEEEENLMHLGSQESEVDHLEGAAVSEIVVLTEEAKITKYSDEINLQGDNLVIIATEEKRETETAPNNDVDSKCDSTTHLPGSEKSTVLEDCSKNSEAEEKEILTYEGSQESKVDDLEGAASSANVVTTEETKITRQVSERRAVEVETGERSSAWSNIMSFAKEFANFWRKK
ncbi:unnamed protein product [Arabis nemorensis]|uniref:AT3G52170-like helix-turn-helix domain-containing protein n=1 Tax=Arabis nemorensis TaxID=586526 RepID=A0A565CS69_9BRAS|nr:unnamed protein product [Arabis nemorensis]